MKRQARTYKIAKSNTHFVYFISISAIINNSRYKNRQVDVYKVGYSKNVPYRIKMFTSVNSGESVVRGLGIKIVSVKVLSIKPFPDIELAKRYESYIKIKYVKYKYLGHPILANGNTELFNVNVLELETMNAENGPSIKP